MKIVMKGNTEIANCYNTGYHAGINNKSVSECPYSFDTHPRQVKYWLEGYYAGCKDYIINSSNISAYDEGYKHGYALGNLNGNPYSPFTESQKVVEKWKQWIDGYHKGYKAFEELAPT